MGETGHLLSQMWPRDSSCVSIYQDMDVYARSSSNKHKAAPSISRVAQAQKPRIQILQTDLRPAFLYLKRLKGKPPPFMPTINNKSSAYMLSRNVPSEL